MKHLVKSTEHEIISLPYDTTAKVTTVTENRVIHLNNKQSLYVEINLN